MEKSQKIPAEGSLHWGYKALGAVSSLTGLSLLILLLSEVSSGPSYSADGSIWTWGDKLFLLHVPIILSLLLLPGGIGLISGKHYGWSLLSITSATLVVMSLFMISSADDPRLGGFMQMHLPEILFLQTLSAASLAFLAMPGIRQRMKIRLSDILIAVLFAMVLLLDWFVSLFQALSMSA